MGKRCKCGRQIELCRVVDLTGQCTSQPIVVQGAGSGYWQMNDNSSTQFTPNRNAGYDVGGNSSGTDGVYHLLIEMFFRRRHASSPRFGWDLYFESRSKNCDSNDKRRFPASLCRVLPRRLLSKHVWGKRDLKGSFGFTMDEVPTLCRDDWPESDVTIDNSDSVSVLQSGGWLPSKVYPGYLGTNYHYSPNAVGHWFRGRPVRLSGHL